MRRVKSALHWAVGISMVWILFGSPGFVFAAAGNEKPAMPNIAQETVDGSEEASKYGGYKQRFEEIEYQNDIAGRGFDVIEEQIFPIEMGDFGEVFFIPAMDAEYDRLILLFAGADGEILYKTEQLETNSCNRGQTSQPNMGISAVSFQDLNGDGLMDIVLITSCIKEEGDYAGKLYKVGDVLFQNEEGTGFYRDYRISDKINRFGMNKSVESIVSFVRDGNSTEFLYTAATRQELVDNGFHIISEQCYYRQFEKLGRLEVVPGTYTMASFATFMIYLVNEQGYIVWSFQPMGEYENIYALKGITCRDIDGDGMKDILVLARYSSGDDDNELVVKSDYDIYYQRTGGFYEDTEVKRRYKCRDEDTVSELVEKARRYWGWQGKGS